MCGIAGTVGLPLDDGRHAVEAMCKRMIARGPDDGDVATLVSAVPVVLGSRRLSIIDPTSRGRQPMTDRARKTTIVFNGMIYNFRELRRRLAADGERFDSDCDTEVVLRAYGRWGRDFVSRLEGMFALAIWDGARQTLVLARDRLGIKPLYVTERGDSLAFASQVKALLAGGVVDPTLSADAVRSFLAYGAVSEPLTAIEGIRAFPAATVAEYSGSALRQWRYADFPELERTRPTQAEAVEELRGLLTSAVRRHLVSDAPIGVFLSGGLDSSLVAALAAREHARVRTVSVVFDDPALNEASYIERVAERIGSEHTSVRLGPERLIPWLDGAFDAMDQPTFDGINTYVVSRAAAETGLKVALSGLGADELFDGYGYTARARALSRASRVPGPLVGVVTRAATLALHGDKADKAAHWLRTSSSGHPHDLLRRLFLEPELAQLVPSSAIPRPVNVGGGDLYGHLSRLDLTTYLRNVLLRDTDAMSMSRSLEVRVPYLDDRLVEWALRRPGAVKGERKALLAVVARDLLPREVVERRKQGFLLPLRTWMRTELRDDVARRLREPPAAVAAIVDRRGTEALWGHYVRDGRRWLRPWALYALSRWVDTLPAGARP
jgi:asparagine synthase (glutamine-hydrolysing)